MGVSGRSSAGPDGHSTKWAALTRCAAETNGIYFTSITTPHYAPRPDGLDQNTKNGVLSARFHCYEECGQASKIALRFKVDTVARSERFGGRGHGEHLELTVFIAVQGRDFRTHTVTLAPYLQPECALMPEPLSKGENVLGITPARLHLRLFTAIHLVEIERIVDQDGD